MQGVKTQCQALGKVEPQPEYQQGTVVTITEGCFKHLQAIVQATKGEERVILLMQLLNGEHRLDLPLSAIQAG